MCLKTRKDCYVHRLFFADYQVVISQGVPAANNIGRKIEEEYEIWGSKITYAKTEYCAQKLRMNWTATGTKQNR
jgi:hypothetical protein